MPSSFQENFFTSFDKSKLFYQAFLNTQQPIATIVAVHGLGAHCGFYTEFAQVMNQNQVNVIALSQRGHGLSDGQRGFVKSFSHFEKDLNIFLKHIQSHLKIKTPLFLLGESMGGLVVFKTLIGYGDKNLNGVIFVAPLFGLQKEVPAFKESLARWTAKYFPRLTLFNEIQYEECTKDPQGLEFLKKDVFHHRRISPRLFLEMQNGIGQLPDMSPNIKKPVLILSSQNDPIISSRQHKNIFNKLGSSDKSLNVHKNVLHNIFLEKTKMKAFEEIRNWVKEKVKA